MKTAVHQYPSRCADDPHDLCPVASFGRESDSKQEQAAEVPEPYKKALLLWLQWNAAYERVTETMCQTNQDQQALQSLMDQMDHLRKDAVELSHDLLD
jgi:hypothetical protein